MKKNKKGKRNQATSDKINQQVSSGDKQSNSTSKKIIVKNNALQHVRNDHRIPEAAKLKNGQLNFDGPLLNENHETIVMENIFD